MTKLLTAVLVKDAPMLCTCSPFCGTCDTCNPSLAIIDNAMSLASTCERRVDTSFIRIVNTRSNSSTRRANAFIFCGLEDGLRRGEVLVGWLFACLFFSVVSKFSRSLFFRSNRALRRLSLRSNRSNFAGDSDG